MANTINIDLTTSGETFYDDHGANITSETAVVAVVKYLTVPETTSFIIDIEYYISQAARNLGGTKTTILKIVSGEVERSSTRLGETVSQAVFDTATPTVALNFIAGKLEDFFGVGSTTIV